MKAPPAEQLLHQHPAAAYPDRAQLRKPHDLRFGVGRHRLALLGLHRVDLPLDQRQPRALALDLGTHPGQKLPRVAAPPALPQAPADILHPQVL